MDAALAARPVAMSTMSKMRSRRGRWRFSRNASGEKERIKSVAILMEDMVVLIAVVAAIGRQEPGGTMRCHAFWTG